MKVKPWCTQNNGDCSSCSLVNYERDCLNVPVDREGPEQEQEEELNLDPEQLQKKTRSFPG